jgi:hypothetical protein
MHIVLALGLAVVAFVLGELGRTLAARAAGVSIDRALGIAIGFRGSRPRRALAIVAGPITTYLAVALLVFVVHCRAGFPDDRLFVEMTLADHDAHGKLRHGDLVLAVDGHRVEDAHHIRNLMRATQPARVTIDVLRDGTRRSFEIATRPDDYAPRIGAQFVRGKSSDLGRATAIALAYPARQARDIVVALFVLGEDAADPGGPIRIVQEFQAPERTWLDTVRLGALFATYVLLLVFIADLVRLALLARRSISHPS